jgi:DNA polymerase III alpha subunit (gram-positive type)
MRFNNHTVVFDLETTDDPSNRSIIEIGAVILSPELSRIGARFQALVRPNVGVDYVSDRVVELTGHTRDSLKSAKLWDKVTPEFENWVKDICGNIKKVRLAAWGNYFDINVLRDEYDAFGLPFPFSGTCIDVKTAALMWASMSGRRTDSLSVASAAKELGLEPIGSYHRADVDAEMTARIFQSIMAKMSGGVWVGKQYIAVAMKEDES